MSKYLQFALAGVLLLQVACGGSGSSKTSSSISKGSGGCANTALAGAAANVLPLTVDGGPNGNYIDAAFATVKICVPGSTSNCHSIDHVLVDTGSEGLRLLASSLTIATSLPAENVGGNPVVECSPFLSFLTWGPVELADVYLSGEVAHNIPIQVIGDSRFPVSEIPQTCLNFGGSPLGTQSQLGANGILGIGVFPDDCGISCYPPGSNSSNPGMYYTCPGGSCQTVALASESQEVQNPVSSLAGDNNGTIIQLPAISASGSGVLSGSLVFGIGTQSNNALNSATVLALSVCTSSSPASCLSGDLTTTYQGVPYPDSFIDSGSNGLFILNSTLTGLPACKTSTAFYCPSTPQSLTATNQGANNGNTNSASFTVANADSIGGSIKAYDLAGPSVVSPDPSGSGPANYFDFGLPLFFGCNIYTAIYGKATPGGNGPYVAY